MDSKKCETNADIFCYVCAKYTVTKNRRALSSLIETLYQHYFHKPLIKNVWWAPAKFCANCYNALSQWSHGKLKSMRFGVPMVWSDPIEHKKDRCYFCVHHNVGGHTIKTSRSLVYRSVPPHAEMPRPHSDTVPFPTMPAQPSDPRSSDTNQRSASGVSGDQSGKPSRQPSGQLLPNAPRRLTQENLNDLIGELGLPADGAALLGSHFKKWNLLQKGVTFPLPKDE